MRPAAFASGGRSHCIRYLSGSFDILRQFAFEKLARREVSGHRCHGLRTHRNYAPGVVRTVRRQQSQHFIVRSHVIGRLRKISYEPHARAEFAQCLSTNTLMKAPTKATRLLIKLAQNVTPLRNDAGPGAQCTASMLLN